MGSLFEMVKKLLGSGGSGSMGGTSGGMGSLLGGSGGTSVASGGSGGSGGMSMGSMLGSIGGGGASTEASDHAMGLSALQHYKDMSQPNPNMPMGLLAQLNAMNNAGGPITQFMPQNALIQSILANYRGY